MALLGFGQSLGKREQGGIGCDEVTTTTGHRIGDSVSAVAAQCDGVGVTLLSQAEEREGGWGAFPALLGSVRCGEQTTAKRLHRERSSAQHSASYE